MIDDDLRAVVLGIILLAAAFTAYQGFFPKQATETFSELAILGPGMKIEDYPKELLVNESFTLYIYIANHEGSVMYYRVLIKLGNRSSFINETTPLDAPIIEEYERILMNNESRIHPVELSIDEPGENLRLVFEMWIYDETLNDFKYHGRWNQLWLNVIALKPIQ